MPAVVVPVATWIAGAVSTGLAAIGIGGVAGGWLTVAAYTVSEIALYAGMSYAVDAASRPKLKPAGTEILFNMDPAFPREMIIGQRLVGGSMVARYSRGSNLYNAHLVIQVADHPCVELSKVYDGGRVVQDTPLTHGVRTEITAYSNSGGARVWMTWHDGRPGQTADSDLVTKSAQDPEVVAGKIPAWTNDHVGAGCAYIHVEVQWDSDILTSIPQFTWLVKGARLYDRRLDSTAGGSGSHRLDDPSTWEYSTNAAVAADHFLLGYKVEDEDLAFGIGLHPSEVPYEIFANQADLADEDVETGTGDDVETIKRYAANGVISTSDYFEEVLEAFQVQMAARFVDLGGRIGILGAEEREISLDLSDMDLVSDEQMQFADKLPFSDLYGSVSGTYADPANLFQQTPYTTQTTAYNALPDGGEAQQAQLPLPFEIHPRRADRLASAWINRESLQPRLVGVFMAVAWALEPGDWFTFSSERLALTEAKFEVIDIAKHDDFTVTITARAIDPDFLAFSVDDDPEIRTPPEVEPFEKLLEEPAFTPTATTISGGGATEPVIQVVTTAPNPVARELVIEAQEWNGSALTGPVLFFTGHADDLTTILRQGLKPGTAYKVRMKARSGARESPWSDWSSVVTTSSTYVVPAAGSASGDLSDALDDIDAALAAADSRLDAAEDDLALQGTAIGDLETITDGHATSITGLQAVTATNPNLFRNPSGAGDNSLAIPSVWWGVSGGAAGGGLMQARYDWLGGPIYLEAFADYSGATDRYYGLDVPIVNHLGGPITVSWIGRAENLDNTVVQLYGIGAASEDRGASSQVALTGSGRRSVTLTPTGVVATLRLYMGIPAQTKSGYSDIGIRAIKVETGSVATLFTDELGVIDARGRVTLAEASITEIEDVQADHDSAIATLDSRLDAAESDIDGVQSTASNLSTRMAAVDGGSASAQTLAQVKAELEGDIGGEAAARAAAVATLESADATEAAARAAAVATVTARMSSGESEGLLRNARLSAPLTSGVPEGFNALNASAGSLVARWGNAGGNAYRLPGGAGVENRISQSLPVGSVKPGQRYRAVASTVLTVGTYDGAGVFVDFRNAAGVSQATHNLGFAAQADLSGETSNSLAGLRNWEFELLAPATSSYAIVYGFSHAAYVSGGNAVANSIDWQMLDLIPVSGRLASAEAAVTSVEDALADEVSARASAISSVEADIGDVESDVTVIQSALAAPDGATAVIAMEADADGVVTGFKIISSNGHSTPISLIEFTAALASFTGDVIVAGSITADRIVTDGITEFDSVATSSSVTFDGTNSFTWVTLFTAASVVVPADAKVVFDFSFIIQWASTSGAGEIQMRLRRDSTTIESWTDISTLDNDTPGERRTSSFSSSEVDTPGAGTYTYTLQVMLDELGSVDPLCYLREGKATIKQFYR